VAHPVPPPRPAPSRPPDGDGSPLVAGAEIDPPASFPGLDPPERLVDRVAALRHRFGLDARLLVWVGVAAVALGVGAWLLRPSPAPFEETIPTASSAPPERPGEAGTATQAVAGSDPADPGASSTTVPSELVAHAAGAVARPGVYRLSPSARVDDLVRAAGGLAADADAGRVNLAAPLVDGAQVYVPRVGEEAPPPVAGPAPPSASASGGSSGPGGGEGAADAPIDVNTATEEELDALPGVGPSIAAAIVAYREENGGFTAVEELLEVPGIGEAKLAEITPLVTT